LKGKHPEKMCVKDIASRMIEKSSNVPRIIDRLFIKKLIKRTQSETDGRHTLIELTALGISMLEKATVKLDEIMANSVILSNAEAATLNLLLEKVRTKE
jgi:DNA-binding MarR family transcriptional regulator